MKPVTDNAGATLGSELQNPILDIAASFWEPERYRAFRVCYASMRRIDDLVDDLRARGLVDDRAAVSAVSEELSAETLLALAGEGELAETIQRFEIPVESWTRLAGAMRFDLTHDRFANFLQFRRYARGAAIAPAAVFIHLIALKRNGERWSPAPVDPFASARDMALFSYLTHILRDFREDFSEGLEYVALDLRKRFSVSDAIWKNAGAGDQAPEFTELVRFHYHLARRYQERARVERLAVRPHLTAQYRFSLTLIWRLYSQILDKIEQAEFSLDPELIHPSRDEIVSEIQALAVEQNLSEEILSAGLRRLGVIDAERDTL